jgi:hypothetical protein
MIQMIQMIQITQITQINLSQKSIRENLHAIIHCGFRALAADHLVHI